MKKNDNILDIIHNIKELTVLNSDDFDKSVIFLGKINDNINSIIIKIKRKNFPENEIKDFLNILKTQTNFHLYFENDIFTRYNTNIENKNINELDIQIIYPATEKLILKYSKDELFLMKESFKDYEKFIYPFIMIEREKSLQWIYNILEKKAEVENIIFEDIDPENGFILIPDYEFLNKTNKEELHIIAIINQRSISGLRELNNNHIELLENIRNKGIEFIKDKYNCSENNLRIFLHYHPTYYHLHVHFTHINLVNKGFHCERAHLLDNVIQNIKIKNNYYQFVTISYPLTKSSNLYKHLIKNNYEFQDK